MQRKISRNVIIVVHFIMFKTCSVQHKTLLGSSCDLLVSINGSLLLLGSLSSSFWFLLTALLPYFVGCEVRGILGQLHAIPALLRLLYATPCLELTCVLA